MEFKKDANIVTDGFWYDMFEGGYIEPKKLLKNQKDISKLNSAIATLELFKMEAEKQDVLQEY